MTSNAVSFNREVRAWVAKLPERDWIPFLRFVVLTFLREVVYTTPVKTGRLRGNWQVGGEADVLVNQNASLIFYDRQGGITVLRGAEAMGRVSLGETIWVFNNIEYSGWIEFGDAHFQGYHMTERALAKMRLMFPDSVAA